MSPIQKWRPWFAWFPVWVETGRAHERKGYWVWFKQVERASYWAGLGGIGPNGWTWAYRQPGTKHWLEEDWDDPSSSKIQAALKKARGRVTRPPCRECEGEGRVLVEGIGPGRAGRVTVMEEPDCWVETCERCNGSGMEPNPEPEPDERPTGAKGASDA